MGSADKVLLKVGGMGGSPYVFGDPGGDLVWTMEQCSTGAGDPRRGTPFSSSITNFMVPIIIPSIVPPTPLTLFHMGTSGVMKSIL